MASEKMEAMKKYLTSMLEKSMMTPLDVFNQDPRQLPVRELPPGRQSDLYHLYQARLRSDEFCLFSVDGPAIKSGTKVVVLAADGCISTKGQGLHIQTI